MASPFDCNVCMHHFNIDTERRPMSLSCGHTMCLDCITRMPTKTCPSCRNPFNRPVPNFSLRDIISSAALTPVASQQPFVVSSTHTKPHVLVNLQAKRAVEAQLDTITTKVASMLLEVDKSQLSCPAPNPAQPVTAQQQQQLLLSAAAHKRDLQWLAAALPPVKLAMGPSELDSELSSEDLFDAHVAQESFTETDGHLTVDHPDPVVVMVDSNDLGEVLARMRTTRVPTVYDFQGRQMKHTGSADPTILANGVTWRNGSIMLRREGFLGQSLLVRGGSSVVLEALLVLGGENGVMVMDGGSVTMTGCEVRDSTVGVCIEDSSRLVARNLRVLNCSHRGIELTGSGYANVTDCEINAAKHTSIFMEQTSRMVGHRLHFTDAEESLIRLRNSARLTLTGCTLTGNDCPPGSLRGESLLVLASSPVDGEFKITRTATLRVDD